jgi:hypothetical protein
MEWSNVVNLLLTNIVLPLVSAVILALLAALLRKAIQKYNLKIDQQTQDAILGQADILVRSMDEKMANAAKKGAEKITGAQAMAKVVEGLILQFPKLTPEKATEYATAMVQKIPGVGATGNPSPGPPPEKPQ